MWCIAFDAECSTLCKHDSRGHLTHADTAQTVREMLRVPEAWGLAFLAPSAQIRGLYPQFGEGRALGAYWPVDRGVERGHSVFTDNDGDRPVSEWRRLSRLKAINCVGGDDLAEDDWRALSPEAPHPTRVETWMSQSPSRRCLCRDAYLYYFLLKPSPPDSLEHRHES